MTKIAYTNKVALASNPVAEINKVTDANMNEIKTSVNKLYDVAGWVEYKDLTNTSSNKQSLTAGQETALTIDGASTIKTYKPLDMGTAELWASNKITPLRLGDTYSIRIDFNAEIANSNGYFDFGIYIDGAIGYAIQDTYTFPKGAGTAHRFSLNYTIYCLQTFLTNGGILRINPSHTMLVWDKRIILSRIYSNV
jgi:hypothetical protein